MAAYIEIRREIEHEAADPSAPRMRQGRQLEAQRQVAETEAWKAVRPRG